MKISLLLTILMGASSFIVAGQKSGNNLSLNELHGQRLLIHQQCFASHDRESTFLDTVQALPGDYIDFADNGLAYCYFNGKHDTLEYQLIGKDSISFGDTPFHISRNGSQSLVFYQNEEEKNGDYNRVTYMLSRKDEILHSNNK